MLLFSSQEQKKQIESKIQSTLQLKPTEMTELVAIENKIDPAKNPKNFEKDRRVFARTHLDDNKKEFLTRDKIYKFIQESELFKNMVMDETLDHVKSWKNSLKVHEHVSFKINSLDGEHSISVNSLYMGEYCYNKYQDAEKAIPKDGYISAYWLDQACKAGFFHALAEELKADIEEIKKPSATAEQKDTVDKELEALADLYGVMGSFHAAITYLDLHNTLGGEVYQTRAAGFYLMGKQILEHKEIKQTQEVLNVITKGEGVKKFDFGDWNKTDQTFLQSFSNDHIDRLKTAAIEIVEEKIKHRMELFSKTH